MIKKILVAYDGSAQSEKAYDYALDIARKYSAPITVLSVVRPPEPLVAEMQAAVLDSATEYYRTRFRALKEKADAVGICVRQDILEGHPAEQIVHRAVNEYADMIVIGHRGESFMQKWLLGSVARRVLSYAHCPVLVIR
ncbi:MAG: universal stress protein [Desulfobacterales bacterium]